MTIHVLSIGNCGADNYSLESLFKREFAATLDTAGDRDSAASKIHARKYSLILVNRLFDSNGESGIDFISDIVALRDGINVMLISNYADAQNAAVANGALKGFGKSQLGDSATIGLIKTAIENSRFDSNVCVE